MNTWWGAIGLCLGLLVGLIIHYWKSFVGMYGEKGGELPAIKRNIDLILDEQKKTTETQTGPSGQ